MFPHAKDIWRNIHVFQRGLKFRPPQQTAKKRSEFKMELTRKHSLRLTLSSPGQLLQQITFEIIFEKDLC